MLHFYVFLYKIYYINNMKALQDYINEDNIEQTALSSQITDICGLHDYNTIYAINNWITKNSVTNVSAYSESKNKQFIDDSHMLSLINFSDSLTTQMAHDYDLNTNPQELCNNIFAIPDMLKVNKPNNVIIYIKANRGI